MLIVHTVVPAAQAASALDAHRRSWKPGEPFAIITGTAEDHMELEAACEGPADGGAAILAAAASLDLAAWIDSHAPRATKHWPKVPVPPQRTIRTLFNLSTRERHVEVRLGHVPVQAPEAVFATLGYGGWNACPEPHIHVAMHRHWWSRHLAAPVAIKGDVVECHVNRPPATRAEALVLAREQFAYCPDIVEQGVGSIAKLASGLLDSKFWYFWWD